MSEQSFKIISLYFSLSFHTLHIFNHNLGIYTPTQLKLGTRKGLIKAHVHTNFGWNPIMLRSYDRFFAEKRLKVCHAYRVNHWKELDET